MKQNTEVIKELKQPTLKSAGRPKIKNAKIVKSLIPIERIFEFKEVVKLFQK
jgi:hypothetical protein